MGVVAKAEETHIQAEGSRTQDQTKGVMGI